MSVCDSITKYILTPLLHLSVDAKTRKCLRELEESQWWPRDRILELQNRRLRELVRYAYDRVPYYRHVFEQKGLKSEDIKSSADLPKLPVLTKRVIRENFKQMMAHGFPSREKVLSRTGGSTGEPLAFYRYSGSKLMSHTRRPWPRRLIQALVDNPEKVRGIGIPGLLFVFDCVLRGCLGAGLIDAGADMAFLAVATFIALLVEDAEYSHQQILSIVVCIIIFLIPWVGCLKMVSVQSLLPIGFRWHLYLALSLLFGCSALVLSGVLARFVIQGLTDVNGRDD